MRPRKTERQTERQTDNQERHFHKIQWRNHCTDRQTKPKHNDVTDQRQKDRHTYREMERQPRKTLYGNTMKKQLHRKTDRQKQNFKMIVQRHPYRL